MPTVMNVIQRLLPDGTRPARKRARKPDWAQCPVWPPDLFAVAATLVDTSGCYSHPRYTSVSRTSLFATPKYAADVRRIAQNWIAALQPPADVQRLWDVLRRTDTARGAASAPLGTDPNQNPPPWCDAAMQLMAIADEASTGMGFVAEGTNPFADYVFMEHESLLQKTQRALPYLPASLCRMVPSTEACVQPKTCTVQVGCTLRSLSHHLALLPPEGDLRTRWLFAVGASDLQEDPSEDPAAALAPFNVLLVPFPYRIDGNCFLEDAKLGITPRNAATFFLVRQQWLQPSGGGPTSSALASFLEELVRTAESEVRRVHGIVLPEIALDAARARHVARHLAAKTDLELFVTGVADATRATNSSCAFRFAPRAQGRTGILSEWEQKKHHRWKLTADQIRRYHLGDALWKGAAAWWERIDVSDRTCFFYVLRPAASVVTLVCEDLARVDPVQTAIRAVGPNLVIALLMDGPQLEKRWPGRHATVLADDPGSAVLTLTSLGMVRRSSMPGEKEPRQIALWKEPSGETRELQLPRRTHALLLTLGQSRQTTYTLDGRDDARGTIHLSLTGVRPIKHARPPAWAN